MNTINMGFWELATQPFQYEQKAPIGYLWVSRLSVLLFGKREMALRLFPLLCGVGTLGVFTLIARHYLKTWGAVVAVGILALSPACIYHSVEAKQYSTELFMATLCLWLYIRFHKSASLPALLTWGYWGHHPVVFVFGHFCAGQYCHCRQWALGADYPLAPVCPLPDTILALVGELWGAVRAHYQQIPAVELAD
ncbi:glycosyltransferase family 39 protein [Hymenobacter sp. 5516J-16]|uniref:ArnT family glycosyltransferase n=1 Tax=Hymenobacter sp. 5516J-16 TaxID=2932253 RepID=UPI001FD3ABD3|nr:glycosyltransferase family 39 protein [Hymenobacter sp. 5516J-16]UOQ77039.1 glycosyltransferase family 39 protein [Hymenobacter sp. 5516J-16]